MYCQLKRARFYAVSSSTAVLDSSRWTSRIGRVQQYMPTSPCLCQALLFLYSFHLWGVASSMAHTVIISGVGFNSSIALGQLNKQTGHLNITQRWIKAAGPSPGWLAWSHSSKNSSNNSSATGSGFAAFNILIGNEAGDKGEAITGVQMYPPYAKQTASVKTDSPCHVAVHPNGRWAVAAAYDAGTVSVFEILQASGPAVEISRISPASSTAAAAVPIGVDDNLSAATDGVFLPQENKLVLRATYPTAAVGKAAHEAKFSPDGTLLYVPCLKEDYVRMYKFDAESGDLTPHNFPAAAAVVDAPAGSSSSSSNNSNSSALLDINPVMLSPDEAVQFGNSSNSSSAGAAAAAASDCNKAYVPEGSGPRHVAFHPTLPVAYVLNELSSTIARFDWNMSSGGQLVADFSSEPERITSMLPAGVSTEPVCVKFGVNVEPGSNPPGQISCQKICHPQAGAELAISNDGRFLYASNRGLCEGSERPGVSNIGIFAVEGSTGALKPVAWEDAGGDINFPRHFSLTPDDANTFMLVANQKGESVTVLRRDPASGLLSKVQTVSTAAAGVQQPSFVSVL